MSKDPTILDPVIKAVAEAYMFNVSFIDTENKWVVTEAGDYGWSLYWNSTYSTKEFWEELKKYFFNEGREYEINRF